MKHSTKNNRKIYIELNSIYIELGEIWEMDHKSKIEWCLTKANKGLKKVEPNIEIAKKHIGVATYNLEVAQYLKQGGHTKWCVPTIFYSVYHCFLAVLMKEGYITENQDCTFSLIATFIEEGKLSLEMEKLEKIMSYDYESGLRGFRERFQSGTEMTTETDLLKEMEILAKEIIDIVREDSVSW